MIFRRLLLAISLLFCISTLFAQEVALKSYKAVKVVVDPPQIDGYFNDSAWELAPWDISFVMREPYEGIEPSQHTAFKILYDDDNMYVAIKAYDSQPELIEKRLSRRDDFNGDWVAIALDSYFDRLTAFSFGVSAAGVKNDLRVANEGDQDDSWDPVWYVKTATVSDGWNAEMRIPLTQIRFANGDSLVWGMQLMRWVFRTEEFSTWQHIPQESGRWVSGYGYLTGIHGIKPKKEIELVPYLMGNYETFPAESEDPFNDGTKWNGTAGLDSKIAVTNDFTMNLTVNPDFGQVEADPSEVNLTAFETFFPEKRPFFIEGGNIFDYSITSGDGPMSLDNLFYSRRIGRKPQYEPDLNDDEYIDAPEFTRILGAMKLSGKTRKGLSIGIMESLVDEAVATAGTHENKRKILIEPRTNYFNTRLQQDYNKGKTIIGGMFTATNRFMDPADSLDFLHKTAYTGGMDFTHFWKEKTYFVSAKTVFSQVNGSESSIISLQESPRRFYQRPDADHLRVDSSLTSLVGHGGTIEGGKMGQGHWRYLGWVTWRSPGLELNDQGYLRQADIVQQAAWAQYRFWEPKGIFRTFYLNFNQWSGFDFSGTRLYFGGNINSHMQFNNYWSFGYGIDRGITNINRAELRGGPALLFPGDWNQWVSISSDERKKLTLEFFMFNNWGDKDHSRFISPGIEVKYHPYDALSISIEPSYNIQRRNLQYVETIDYTSDKRYILSTLNANILSTDFRINFSISPEFSIQYWGQPFLFAGNYSDFKRVTNPMADDYYDRFHQFEGNEISYDEASEEYLIDEDMDGNIDYSFGKPDFNFFEFRSNLVARWEYIPGSTIYLVWSQGRTGDNNSGEFNFSNDVNDLFTLESHNIFLVKISFRISM